MTGTVLNRATGVLGQHHTSQGCHE